MALYVILIRNYLLSRNLMLIVSGQGDTGSRIFLVFMCCSLCCFQAHWRTCIAEKGYCCLKSWYGWKRSHRSQRLLKMVLMLLRSWTMQFPRWKYQQNKPCTMNFKVLGFANLSPRTGALQLSCPCFHMLAHLQTRVAYHAIGYIFFLVSHAIGYRLSFLSHFDYVEATLMSD